METYSVPTTITDFITYEVAFNDQLLTNGGAWGVPVQKTKDISQLKQTFEDKQKIASDPLLSNRTSIIERDAAQKAYRDAIIDIINTYVLNKESVSAASKEALNVKTPASTKSEILPPASHPIIEVTFVDGPAHKIKYIDSDSKKSALPKGVGFIEVVYKIGAPAPTDPDELTARANISRKNNKIAFKITDVGGVVYYYARYINSNGKKGPWSAMVQKPLG